MSKNGTLQYAPRSGQDESPRTAADMTVRARTFFTNLADPPSVSGNDLAYAMQSAGLQRRIQEFSAWTSPHRDTEIRTLRGDAAIREGRVDAMSLALACEAVGGCVGKPPDRMAFLRSVHGDGGRFHSAGGLAH